MAQAKVSPELHNRPTHVKLDISDKIIRGFTYVIVSLFSLMCIIPFWMIVASSFASEASIRLSGFTLWPSEFSAYSYELLLKSPDQMIGAYVVTICLAVVGTGNRPVHYFHGPAMRCNAVTFPSVTASCSTFTSHRCSPPAWFPSIC